MPAHHHIDYVELPVTDMTAAKDFYAKAFGWAFEDWGPEYQALKDCGLEGGLRKVEAAPPRGGALIILYSDDLDVSEKAVAGAGGEIVERHEFPGGRRFHFLDPVGNELAVWTKA